MRAVIATKPGPPEVLEVVELPDVVPAAGQVLVEVAVAATTFVDTQLRAGTGPRPLRPADFPVVLGNGVAGRVVATGDGVDRSWIGERVVTTTGGRGGYAALAVAGAEDLHRIPEGLDEQTAAAMLADGRTALGLLDAAAIRPGEVVAVTAAGGGVGSLLVQLAADAGAVVVALAGDHRKLGRAAALGASSAVNYRSNRWASQLPPALDVVFDGVGGGVSAVLAARVAAGGRYVQHGAASGAFGTVDVGEGVEVVPLSAVGNDPAELHRFVDDALDRAASGHLRPTIGQVVPLERAADAHAAMDARAVVGKTLLLV